MFKKRIMTLIIGVMFVTAFALTMTNCKDSEDEQIINPCAAGHAWGVWNTTTPATCVATGTETRVCTQCAVQDSNTITIDDSNHDWEITSEDPAATCEEDGFGSGHCKREGCEETIENDVLPAIGHQAGAAATCTTPQRCIRYGTGDCTHEYQAALGHSDIETDATAKATGLCQREIDGEKCGALLYALGDTGPAGGVIFYVADGQEGRPLGFTVEGNGSPSEVVGIDVGFNEYTAHYLEAAPSNHTSNVPWGANGTLIENGLTTLTSDTHADYNKIGNGRKDTQIIVAHLGTNETGRAAEVAAAASFGDKNDWFLPSTGELNLLYEQRNLTGIGITSGYFWSSSQSSSLAWYQSFGSNGLRGTNNKLGDLSVRAIRAF